jgi:hypothetical protein
MRFVTLTVLSLCAAPLTAQQPPSIQDLLDRMIKQSTEASDAARLRVTNRGTETLEDLTVIFPDGQVEFGDIPAGATTAYEAVPGGVYRDAGYQLEIDGRRFTKPVSASRGEVPMEGSRFTYRLDFDPDGALGLGPAWETEVIKDE